MAESWNRSVFSSMVSALSYDGETSELTVEWAKGGSGVFSGVSEDVANSAANAPSVGNFVHNQLKPNYPYRRGD